MDGLGCEISPLAQAHTHTQTRLITRVLMKTCMQSKHTSYFVHYHATAQSLLWTSRRGTQTEIRLGTQTERRPAAFQSVGITLKVSMTVRYSRQGSTMHLQSPTLPHDIVGLRSNFLQDQMQISTPLSTHCLRYHVKCDFVVITGQGPLPFCIQAITSSSTVTSSACTARCCPVALAPFLAAFPPAFPPAKDASS